MNMAEMAALHAACFSVPRPWNATEFEELLSQGTVFAIFEPGGFVVGRAVAGETELLTLAVDPDARRRGLGLRLVEGLLSAARARNTDRVYLEVAANNTPALALYERSGFQRAGTRPGYYRHPDGQTEAAIVLMRLV